MFSTVRPRVAFPMRVDALDKPGGDLVQVQTYIRGGAGEFNGGARLFDGEILTDPRVDLSGFDVVHLTNLDRPVDSYAAFRAAKAAGKPIVFSTIHHSYQEIAAYEKGGRGGLAGQVSGIAGFQSLELLKTLVRARRYSKLLAELPLILTKGVRAAQLAMLLGVNRVLVLTEKERRDLETDCPGAERAHFTVVPNARLPRAMETAAASPVERSTQVCVVGRIEARKNQIAILEALEQLGVAGVFIGGENPNHAAYCDRFKTLIAKSRSTYLGAIPHAESLGWMVASKVHVSASWFEVFSLVDLEAYDQGCRIVASRCGGTQEWLGARAEYIEPSSVASIATAIETQLAAHDRDGVPVVETLLPGWGEVVQQLSGIYREVMREDMPELLSSHSKEPV